MPIDDSFFSEVCDRLQPSHLDVSSLEIVLGQKGMPHYVNNGLEHYMGFVMEAHLKQILSELERRYPVASFEGNGVIRFSRRRIYFDTSDWGNVSFYERHDYRYGGKVARTKAEIDGVYVWNGELVEPIIFEVTRTGGNRNFGDKTKFVERLFERPPYYCKVRFARASEGEGPGLYFMLKDCNGNLYNYRKLLVEDAGQYEALSIRLMEKATTESGLPLLSRSS